MGGGLNTNEAHCDFVFEQTDYVQFIAINKSLFSFNFNAEENMLYWFIVTFRDKMKHVVLFCAIQENHSGIIKIKPREYSRQYKNEGKNSVEQSVTTTDKMLMKNSAMATGFGAIFDFLK